MLEFSQEWFVGEEIDGFFVEETMKRAWAAELEQLSEIDRICRENDIRYFADWGTLLGAVRHHGFIPWDDDIDIAIPRPDLLRFSEIAARELPEGWSFHDCYNTLGYHKMLRRVITGDTIDFGEKRMKSFHGFPYPVGIDISTIEYLPRDEEERETLIDMYTITASALSVCQDPASTAEKKEQYYQATEQMLGVNLDRTRDMPTQLVRLMDAVASMYGPDDSDIVGQLHYIVTGAATPKSEDSYLCGERFEFENITIPVPYCYDEVLTEWYGDYKIKRRNPSSHDYPFYREMQERVRWTT